MHAIQFLEPCPELRPYIRFYAERQARLSAAEIVHPMPARSMYVIEFLFRDRYTVWDCTRREGHSAHRGVVVGLQTSRRIELFVHGEVLGFSIFLFGHALTQLLAIPAPELTNAEYEATAFAGPEFAAFGARLGDCRTTQERVAAADEFFRNLAGRAEPGGGIVAAAKAIRRQHGCCRLDTLASQTGLSVRQFERRFMNHVGLGPKLYARIVRFEAALELKSLAPSISWTTIAHRLEYHDQMHMVHDFKRLAGAAPHAIFQELQTAITTRS